MAASSQTKSLKTSLAAGPNFGTFERYAAMFYAVSCFDFFIILPTALRSFYFKM
jgi:hypothetical protein